MSKVRGDELPDPYSVFRPDGLETRIRILKVDGPDQLLVAPAIWR